VTPLRPFRLSVLLLSLSCLSPFAANADEAASAAEKQDFSLTRSVQNTAEKLWDGAQSIAVYALGTIGVNYKFGGNTPEGGLDCSGLVRYVFQQVTGVTLPRTAREMSRLGDKVAKNDLKPGDLVFFNTRRLPFSHVGIYLGDDRFIHAPSKGSEVEISQLGEAYWQKHFTGGRRLYGVLPELAPLRAAQALTSSANAATLSPVTTGSAPVTTESGAESR
jgi:cell wall-associated NlpC family hydrolase